jgi:hypothetical protein
MAGEQINTLLHIDTIWCAVSVDDDGTEGVCAVNMNGQWLPLVAADEKRLEFIRQQAAMISRRDQRLVRVIKLTTRTEIEKFDGRY